ncbi:putative at hook domain-containing protein [Phaeomoniella chlamydospora]|uniref:Putative at hook domain-containing protein n=1 Tax=Phaeomoniella chlamydospora TaxID=158046 RepID=A0A0G2EAH5_PHACM|nr:putative at hook domain-containing protein [Phaeomoniella chlamydospora]
MNHVQGIDEPSQPAPPSEPPVPSTRKRKRNSEVPITIHEDVVGEELPHSPAVQHSPVVVDKENAAPKEGIGESSGRIELLLKPEPKVPTKRRKRKSVGQQRKKKRASSTSVEELSNPEAESDPPEDSTAPLDTSDMVVEDEILQSIIERSLPQQPDHEPSIIVQNDSGQVEDSIMSNMSTVSVNTRKARRKRKSIGQQRKKKRSSTDALPGRRRTLDFEASAAQDSEGDNDFVPEDIETSPVVETRKKTITQSIPKRKRRAETLERVMPSIKPPSASSNTTDRIPAPKRRRVSTGPRSKESTRSTGIPILIHRMKNFHALPTIPEEVEPSLSDGEASADELSHPRRPQLSSNPNSVDVISQLCRETIESVVSKLSSYTPSNNQSRSSLLRRQKAIEVFGENLDVRFFEMSQVLDTKTLIEAQVKKSKREKMALQNEWLEIRRQREEIALKCDDVRRRNLESEKRGRDARELNEGVEGLEISMEHQNRNRRGYSDSEGVADGLEYLLKKTKEDVVGIDGSGGTFVRIKEFNGILERVIGALERKP